MANISLKAQGRKSMADSNEIKQTPIPQEEEQFEGGFTPIVKFSQDFDRLSKSGKLEYPKYRTLSEEQTRSYIKLNELPEYKRLQMRNDVKAASEQSLWQNTKNAFINTMADAFSKEKTELALGNLLVSGDYEPANVVRDLGFKETEKSKSLQGIQDLISEPEYDTKEGRTKLQALGLAMTKDALDGLEYRAAVMPKVDEDSWGSLIGGGVASALTFYASGIGGRALGRGIAKPLSKRAKQPHTKAVQDRYSDIVASKTADVTTSAYMYNQVLGEGALSSIEKYIEDTGDVNLDNYTGDLGKIGFDIVSARIQDVIEKKLGFGRFINNPRLVTKYGEWLNGFAQEFSQGEVSDIFEWIKGNKTFEEVIKNIPNNIKAGVIGSPLQGIPGTAYYTYYHNKTVNELTDAVMSQSTPENPLDQKKVRSFVEDKVRQLEEGAMIDMAKELSDFSGATQYRGKIYDTIRDNVEKTINYQREVMKDTLEGSKYDDMSEEELAQHIEAVAEDNADRAVIDALERKVPLSESPLLKGETLEGTYYVEGSDYAKETERQAQENRQMIRDAVYAAKQAEKSAKEAANEAKKIAKEQAKQANSVKTETKKAITGGNVDVIGSMLSDAGFKVRDMSGSAIKELAKLNWQLFQGKDLGTTMSKYDKKVAMSAIEQNVESGNDVLMRAGYTKEQIEKMDDETWNRAVLTQYNKEQPEIALPEFTEEELAELDSLDFQDLAEENARLDEVNPEYTGETIRIIDPVELKQAQFEIVQETNPMQDDYHVGIRSVNDIKTFAETINDEESFVWGDYSREDAQRDLAKNEITVYSSYPIENGVFVSTSYRQAEEYAGGKGSKVYERTVPLDFVAWINGDEGQFAMTDVIGKKRTVYNSNGERIAKSAEALTNFWKWFGDSKVVDEDGRPLVVYHGSDVSGIEVFDNQANQTKQRQIGAEKGYFFTDSKKVAERFRTPEQRKAESKYYAENTVREPVEEEKYDAQGRYLGSVHYVKTTLPKYKNFGLYPVYLKAESVNEYDGEDIGVGVERETALESAKQSGKDGVIIYNADTGAGIANEYIVFEPNQIKSTQNRGTFSSDTGNIYYQETEQNDNRELVVTHGITLDKLEKALELGGLPVPSIAISKVSEPLKGFGAIKLVGTKDIIDPENRSNLVYDRDIWSKRFPRPEYKNAKLSDVRKFRDKFEKYFIKTDDNSVLYGSITDPLVNSRYPAQAIDAFQSSKGAKLYYIENFLGEKIDIPKYDRAAKMLDNLTLFVSPDEKFIEEISKIDSNIDNSIELKKQIEKPIKDLIERFDFEKKYGQIYAERFKKEAEDYYFGEKFRTSDMFNLISQSKNYLRTLAEKDGFVRYAVDNYALSSILGKYKLYENEDYMKWSEKQITDLMGEPRVKVGNKMMPWTLENITSAMIKGKTVGSETNTAEIGKIFASGATKFSSIKSIREKGQALQTKEQSEAQTDELGKDINYLADDIVSYAGFQGFAYTDNVLMALEEGVSKTNITEDSFERLLNKNLGTSKSFPKVLLKRGVNLIKDVKKVVRYYFEAKPQRAVMLEEFVGAVIPTDSTYDKISHKLTERGLIVKRTDDLRTGIQDIEAQKTVLFQDRQRGKGGAYDARTRSITLGGGANATTFFHEFAHYWIDKNFKWARSGKASTAWMQQWRMVEKWLGIDPEDKYLDKIASEKFARAYERFLAEEELPLVLKKAMIDYRDFVLDHYDYELDDAKGLQDKLGRPIRLDDSIKAWFKKSIYQEYMSPAEMEVVNERLALDDQERKDIIPQLEEASEMQAEIANSPELNKIDITGGQIQREAGISNAQILGKRTIGGGEEKVSKGKIAQELGKTYESTNWDIQEQMVSEYLETVSLDEAIDDLDNETYPEKIDANFLRQALVERLLDEGRELEAVALIEQTADDFTQAAQTLQAARKINTPFTNAIRMLTVGKAEKLAQARYGRNENAVAELDKTINALIDKYQSDFMNAQTEEERELVYATMQDEAIKTIGTLDKSRKNDLDFQDTEDKEERKQAKAIRKQQIRRASINGYRSRAKRALKQALGLEPTRQQVRDIKKLSVEVAKQIRDFRKAVNENKTSAIDPTKVLEAQNKLNEYMNKQLPPRVLSTVADATNSFMMANMLWNPATNVFNLESTWVQMLPHMIATRINYGGGTIAWSEKAKLIKQALALQAKTGYNIFSLRDFFDKKTIWAEKYYEPTTSIGKFQRFPLTALGLMDTMNKGIVFLHHADSMATKQAKEEGAKNGWNKEQVEKRAKELFYQALNTDPRTITIDGLKIRKAAVQEGEEATFTQMTKTAELVNKFRKMLNLGGKTGLGNIIMPFTTTVANIAEDTVLNYALGSVRGLVNAPQAIATQFDKTATAEMKKEAWKAVQPETKNVIKNMIGILMILGVALSGTDDDEYVLGYDRQTDVDKDIRTNRNAPYGYAVKIGDKWVDLDLFGIGSPWAKMYLIAKRYGFSTDGWVKGIASNIDLIPGVGELSSMYEKYTTTQERQGSAEAWVEMGAEKLEELSVRLIPMSALFGQLASVADDKKRETWNNWYDKMLAKIPYAREKLPARTSTQTGKELPQTDTIWNLATGQRIKDYIEPSGADKARYEFALEDKTLAYREGNSKLKELGKDTVRYKNAVNKVRKLFSKKLSEESKKASYKRLSIEEKKKVANKLHKEALESVKAEYGLAKKNKKR